MSLSLIALGRFVSRGVVWAAALVLVFGLAGTAYSQPAPPPVGGEPLFAPPPSSLKTALVPEPSTLAEYVVDKEAAITLGKALFWDMQVGSDGVQACASCHFSAGADSRDKNMVSPGANGVFDSLGPNGTLTAADFPFTSFADSDNRLSARTHSDDIVGSQGVHKVDFLDVVLGSPLAFDAGTVLLDPTFQVGGVNARQSTARNTPSTINAVFNWRNFWDGRAQPLFNGVNPSGAHDPSARVVEVLVGSDGVLGTIDDTVEAVSVLIDNASLASQAVGAPNSEVEMAWAGRIFPKLGKKMLAPGIIPLAKQLVHSSDSVLGTLAKTNANPNLPGLDASYESLIQQAFAPQWWDSDKVVTFPGTVACGDTLGIDASVCTGFPTISDPTGGLLTTSEYTLMEANFSLFWGLAVQLYEATLVSDDSRFDRFMDGGGIGGSTEYLLNDEERLGLDIFRNIGFVPGVSAGLCVGCHVGPEMTAASTNAINTLETVFPGEPPPVPELPVEQMLMAFGVGLNNLIFQTDPPVILPAEFAGVLTFDPRGSLMQITQDSEPNGVCNLDGSCPNVTIAGFDGVFGTGDDGSVAQHCTCNNFDNATQTCLSEGCAPAIFTRDYLGTAGETQLGANPPADCGAGLTLSAQIFPTGAGLNINPLSFASSLFVQQPDCSAELSTGTLGLAPGNYSFFVDGINRGTMRVIADVIYDFGFYNIAVTPTFDDVGVGGESPPGQPISVARRAVMMADGEFCGQDPANPLVCDMPELTGAFCLPGVTGNCTIQDPSFVAPGTLEVVDGAFKVPQLRNVELTGPYFHNGGKGTLGQVVDFYNRGGDFHEDNLLQLAPEIIFLAMPQDDRDALVAFLKTLTDERVRYEEAPFDHPGISIPVGQVGDDVAVSDTNLDGNADDVFMHLAAVGAPGNCTGIDGSVRSCDDSNSCTDDSCVPEFGCVNAPNTVFCDDGDSCTTADQCDGAGGCAGVDTSLVDCDDGNICTDDSCDAFAGCTNSNNAIGCSDGNACTTGDTCNAAVCVGGPPPACDDSNVCTADLCDSSVGCVSLPKSVSCDDADPCTIDDFCINGACAGSTPPDCSDGDVCTDDSCVSAAGGCVNLPNSAPCDDGDACTTNDTCQDGVCEGGSAPDCDDVNGCTDDTCDSGIGCVSTNNTVPCDDGEFCTDGDQCSGGSCQPGAARDCSDGNACTTDSCDDAANQCQSVADDGFCDDDNSCTNDFCSTATGCFYQDNGFGCDDGDACTTNDTCEAGVCVGGAPPNCDDANGCTDDVCDSASGCANNDNTAACSDGDACTNNDVCSAGSCVGGAASDCDDGNACTADTCDTGQGCENTNVSVACEDGDACTTADTCSAGVCVGGAAPDCNDDNGCTNDVCDSATGCSSTDNTSACDDGNVCTTGDVCAAGSCGGVDTSAQDCEDGNSCTQDFCNPASGCVNAGTAGSCDDGDACTVADQCINGSCVGGGTLDCDDAKGCTDDSCDSATGCAYSDNTAACDDGDACTTADTCAAGSCEGGVAPDCDDGNVCTEDTCDSTSGCAYSNNTATCDDGDSLTPVDQCVAGQCVGSGLQCPVQPMLGCQLPVKIGKAKLVLKKNALVTAKDRLKWKWANGSATAAADFGDLADGSGEGLSVCFYDEVAGQASLMMAQSVPAGGSCGSSSCWRETPRAIKFSDRVGAGSDGIRGITIKPGADGKAQIVVKGAGTRLGMGSLPLSMDGKATMQVITGPGSCWQADYSSASKNSGGQFKARSSN
jgi:cytochrome c peroxidase